MIDHWLQRWRRPDRQGQRDYLMRNFPSAILSEVTGKATFSGKQATFNSAALPLAIQCWDGVGRHCTAHAT
ncbi:hypothetical protein M2399_006017 [Pseudomonas sp. BIGb0450]|nr:hypothetical protein [Pseudomonas sp. BIGb0558]MCS3440550.1 hypothetical protein [Pseudomonas sp. BIGb0450]